MRAPQAVAAAAGAAPVKLETTRQAVGRALADPSFRLLALGFSVCGFHVAFLATHLPGVVASCGLAPEVGAWALAMLGLFNIVGSLGIGGLMAWRGGLTANSSWLPLIIKAPWLARSCARCTTATGSAP